jgi:hypothetical protein
MLPPGNSSVLLIDIIQNIAIVTSHYYWQKTSSICIQFQLTDLWRLQPSLMLQLLNVFQILLPNMNAPLTIGDG